MSIAEAFRYSFCRIHCVFARRSSPCLTVQQRGNSSLSYLHAQLTSRQLPLSYDYLSPQPSHLLDVSLADYLPPFFGAPAIPGSGHTRSSLSSSSTPSTPSTLPVARDARLLPPAYHLVYFPPAVPSCQLLPDGTDPLQAPGPPFVRRMWAGGRVRWNKESRFQLRLRGGRAFCMEGIRDVQIKGVEGDEKVFVGIERRVAELGHDKALDLNEEKELRERYWSKDEEDMKDCGVIEKRYLVFMRERSRKAAADAAKAQGKVVKPSHGPTFTHTLIPAASLLFRFSALTFNAHAIHLDKGYCRDIEGHKNLLVHGPLSLVLLVSLLRNHLINNHKDDNLHVSDISYRNLAPLYAEEEMKLCGREVDEGKYELWAQTPAGGYAVRCTASIDRTQQTS
ncbi:MAG: hypothetical protein M1835_003213 [Candelina submexicana]|nr:MAG: hypothetical protein M1835_003213 [Candelina submexicana]